MGLGFSRHTYWKKFIPAPSSHCKRCMLTSCAITLYPPDALVCGLHQSDVNHTLDATTHPRVGFLPLCCKLAGYLFQGSPQLHTQYPINGGE